MRNRIAFFLAALFLLGGCLASRAGNAVFYFSDSRQQPQAIRGVNIYYLGPLNVVSSNLVTLDRIHLTSGTNGFVGITNYLAGVYRSEFQGVVVTTTNYYDLPATNGTVNANDWTRTMTNGLNGTNLAYTTAQANARFLPIYTNSHVLFVRTNGNDATAVRGRPDFAWKTVNYAITNAVAGDLMDVGPGQFNIGTNGWYYCTAANAITTESDPNAAVALILPFPTNFTMRGAGPLTTELLYSTNDLTLGGVVGLNIGSKIQDLTIRIPDSGYFQPPIVWQYPLTNVVIRDFQLFANSDGFVGSNGDPWNGGDFYNCYIKTHWDAFIVGGTAGNPVRVFASTIIASWTAQASPLGNVKAITQVGGLELYGCDVEAKGATNICYGIDNSVFSLTLYGTKVEATGSNSAPSVAVLTAANVVNYLGSASIGWDGHFSSTNSTTGSYWTTTNGGSYQSGNFSAATITNRASAGTKVQITDAAGRIVDATLSGLSLTGTTLTATNIYEFALSDETTAIATGTAKVSWRAPHAMTLKDVRASLTTVSSSGLPTVNIKEAGTTIFSTKLTIDASELTSTTAATAYVFSDTAIADDALITFDIDVAGTGATGLKVKIYYTR